METIGIIVIISVSIEVLAGHAVKALLVGSHRSPYSSKNLQDAECRSPRFRVKGPGSRKS